MAKEREIRYCPKHHLQELICPICTGATGGRKTARRYRGQAAKWGKMGGRPKKR